MALDCIGCTDYRFGILYPNNFLIANVLYNSTSEKGLSMAVTKGRGYYFGISLPLAKHMLINITVSDLPGPPVCNSTCGVEYLRGYCSGNNECVCSYFYKGDACQEYHMEYFDYYSLDNNVTTEVFINSSTGVYLFPTFAEKSSYQIATFDFQKTDTVIRGLLNFQSLPTTTLNHVTPGSHYHISSLGCNAFLYSLQSIMYLTASKDITINVTTRLESNIIPYGFNVNTRVPDNRESRAFHFDLPKNCGSVYNVTLTRGNKTHINDFILVVPSSQSSCSSLNTLNPPMYYSEETEKWYQSASIQVVDCSLGIELVVNTVPTNENLVITLEEQKEICTAGCSASQCNFDSLSCQCKYPNFGSDCKTVDKMCMPRGTNFTTCNNPSLILKPPSNLVSLCSTRIEASGEDKAVEDIKKILSLVSLSPSCTDELTNRWKIICDYHNPKCTEEPIGVKLYTPCYSFDFLSRCVSNAPDSLKSILTTIKYRASEEYNCDYSYSSPTSSPLPNNNSTPTSSPSPSPSPSPSSSPSPTPRPPFNPTSYPLPTLPSVPTFNPTDGTIENSSFRLLSLFNSPLLLSAITYLIFSG